MSDSSAPAATQLIKSWQHLLVKEPELMAETNSQLHQAAQFISMLGKHYVSQEPDDSNTNMRWLVKEKVLAGAWVLGGDQDFCLALDPVEFSLCFFGRDMQTLECLKLNGKNRTEVIKWLKDFLLKIGLDSGAYKHDLHYEIALHDIDLGRPFQMQSLELHEEHSRWRHNSHVLLSTLAAHFKHAHPIRTWPHHFDTGLYMPIELEQDKVRTSVSLGWSINDEYQSEPYFYATHWVAKNKIDYDNLPALELGEWCAEGTNMIVLKSSAVSAAKEDTQAILSQAFLAKSIEVMLRLMANS